MDDEWLVEQAVWVGTPLLTVGLIWLVKWARTGVWRISLSYVATALALSGVFLVLHPTCGCIGLEAQVTGALEFSFASSCVLLFICWLLNVASDDRRRMLARISEGRSRDRAP